MCIRDRLKEYSVFCLIKDFSPFLTPEIRDSTIAWNNTQKGVQGKKTDKKLAAELVQNTFGFEFGRLYTEKYFSEEDKKAVETLVHQILSAYKERINGLEWMGETTKEKAIRKLDHMTLKIGYPDNWPDYYENAVILPEGRGSLIDNMVTVYRCLLYTSTQQKIGTLAARVSWVTGACFPGSRKIDEVDRASGDVSFPALNQPEIPFPIDLFPLQKCGQLYHKRGCKSNIFRLNGLLPV